jgi:hypothetical protein
VLVVAVSDERWQRELRRSTKMVLGRLRALLGDTVITRLDITSTPTEGTLNQDRRKDS